MINANNHEEDKKILKCTCGNKEATGEWWYNSSVDLDSYTYDDVEWDYAAERVSCITVSVVFTNNRPMGIILFDSVSSFIL